MKSRLLSTPPFNSLCAEMGSARKTPLRCAGVQRVPEGEGELLLELWAELVCFPRQNPPFFFFCFKRK